MSSHCVCADVSTRVYTRPRLRAAVACAPHRAAPLSRREPAWAHVAHRACCAGRAAAPPRPRALPPAARGVRRRCARACSAAGRVPLRCAVAARHGVARAASRRRLSAGRRPLPARRRRRGQELLLVRPGRQILCVCASLTPICVAVVPLCEPLRTTRCCPCRRPPTCCCRRTRTTPGRARPAAGPSHGAAHRADMPQTLGAASSLRRCAAQARAPL